MGLRRAGHSKRDLIVIVETLGYVEEVAVSLIVGALDISVAGLARTEEC